MKHYIIALLFLIGSSFNLYSQSKTEIIQEFLKEQKKDLELTNSDIQNWEITSQSF